MKKIEKIFTLIDQYKHNEWYSHLELGNEKSSLKELEEMIKEYKPKIAVIGEFSTGKSTLINSFLAKDLLPAKFKPTTSFITNIQYADNKYISVNGEKLEPTKENLENIDNVIDEKIDIYLNNPILNWFTIIDTPGTNDPSKFTDDIVFSLIGDVDIVIFVMNSNQALKETEKQFISKLIRKKDIDKFFFALNWSDTIENPRIVKKEVIEKLTTLLGMERNIVQNHTFLYSAKEVLQNRINNIENSNYEILLENIKAFIENNKIKLLESWKNQELEKIVGSILIKIDTLEDQLLGNSKKYENKLIKINDNIKKFEYEIETELLILEKDFKKIIKNYKKNVKNSVKYILSDISNEVNEMEFDQLIGSRYIELRTKKLLEDKIEEASKSFMKDTISLVNTFDKKLLDSNKLVNNINIGLLERATTSKKVINSTAIMATATGAMLVAPQAAAIAGGTAIVGGVAPLLAMIPGVGVVITGVVGGIGIFAVAAGKILFDVAKWGVGKLGDLAKMAEEKVRKLAYLKEIENSLTNIENSLLKEIDKININEFKDGYIHNKFPQKNILEEKIKLLGKKKLDAIKLAQNDIEILENFKISLIDSIQ